MHRNGIKIELEIPFSLGSIDRTGNAQVASIPVEWAFGAKLGLFLLREEMPKLLDVEGIVAEDWSLSAVCSERILGNLHFWIISSVVT
jgi:hypothetical protein